MSHTVVGRLQLPAGTGARGLQVILEVENEASTYYEWLDLDQTWGFRTSVDGAVNTLEVVAGIDRTIYALDADALKPFTSGGTVDVGTIDLRASLHTHTFKLVSDTAPALRIGMWFEEPPADVSLGSRQFPEVAAGAASSWLLPTTFETVYFLVEKPADEQRGRDWSSGAQHLFGPFTSAELPGELRVP
ncbi:MAG: hypothetical protein AAF970_06675 [Bacteroidota bacterium]